MTTDAKNEMLAQPVSKWTFEFWKQQVEEAVDIPSAVGRLRACTSLDSPKYGESVLLYLMDLSHCKPRSSYSFKTTKEEELSMHACHCLAPLLVTRYPKMQYVPLHVMEKALWFFGPVDIFGSRVDPFSGPDETSKLLRRFRSQLCWSIWKGENSHATLEYKLQVLHIFYSIGRLFELAPSPGYEHHNWDDFEDMLPELEVMAQSELAQLSHYHVTTIEEAAYWDAPACRLIMLVRPILVARTSWIKRQGDRYLGSRVNVIA